MMRYSCLHTHTELCDGTGTVEEYCACAAAKGFTSLGFSAHAPVDHLGITTNWHLSEKDLGRYLELINEAKEKWRGTLDVFAGLEVDYIRGYTGPSDPRWHTLGLDYIIGSVHCVLPYNRQLDWAAPFTKDGKLVCVDGSEADFELLIQEGFSGDVQWLVECYYEDLTEMCGEGGFDILGHADLIVRNNGASRFFSTDSSHWLPVIEKLCDSIVKSNIIVEVNTGGLNRGKTAAPYPSLWILKTMRKKNISVTINADAHSPCHIDGHYNDARAVLFAAGYQEFLLFRCDSTGKKYFSREPL